MKKIVDSRIDYNRKTQLRQKAVDAIIKLYKDDYRPIIQELTHHLANLGQLEEALDVLLERPRDKTTSLATTPKPMGGRLFPCQGQGE